MAGIGPATPSLPRKCSTSEPHQQKQVKGGFFDIFNRFLAVLLGVFISCYASWHIVFNCFYLLKGFFLNKKMYCLLGYINIRNFLLIIMCKLVVF